MAALALVLGGCGSDNEKSENTGPAPATTKTGMASVGDAEFYYEERGTGETVVLVHGLTLDTRMWDAQFEALSETYRVIRLDQRGHGQSSGVTGPYNQADDLLGFLDSLQVDRAHLVGLSMGGFVSYELAVDHPERLLSLTLIDSAWRFDPTRTSDFQTRIVGYLTTAATDFAGGLREWANDALFVPARELPDVWAHLEQIVIMDHLSKGDGAFFKNPTAATTPSPLAETRLGQIATDTLVIVGDLDDPEFVAHSGLLSTSIPTAELVTVTGAGHMSPMEKPGEVTAALVQFLSGQ